MELSSENAQADGSDNIKADAHTKRLVRALEQAYGSPWNLLWRSFFAGFMRALGATVGYILFISLAILIAKKFGVFDALQEMWNSLIQKLTFTTPSQTVSIDPALLKYLNQSQ